jgi:SAM-dependent methyltransferase
MGVMPKRDHMNIHGIEIPSLKGVFLNPRVKSFIQGQWMESWLRHLGYEQNERFALINHAMKSIERSASAGSTNLEGKLLRHFHSPKLGVVERMNQVMIEGKRGEKSRTDVILGYLGQRLHSKARILDFGSGNGLVSYRLATEGHEVTAIDVGDPADNTPRRLERLAPTARELVRARELGYYLIAPGAQLEDSFKEYKENSYDVVLVLTVLHHALNAFNNPHYAKWKKGWSGVLEEAVRAVKPGGLIAVLESVYGGVEPGELITSIGQHKYEQHQGLYEPYFRLTDSEQLSLGVFGDWWLNMLAFKNSAFCPCNFNTMQGWRELFFSRYGLHNSLELVTGFDNLETPEFHVFWYLHKPKNYDNSGLKALASKR